MGKFDSRYVSNQPKPVPFDRDLWRTGKARHRVRMALYLVEWKLLEGKSRSELVEMLGESNADEPGLEGTRWLLGYHAKGLFDETLWLELTINEHGTASGAIVGEDWCDPRRR